ncbi:hypothetical protein [Amycolatopsis sp. NPDC049868]|uniref:hypothetical protein n=1 Tax=Amycolatopsis sp. NPDC049868 TaxID=3363934 RepID=UPI0037918B53
MMNATGHRSTACTLLLALLFSLTGSLDRSTAAASETSTPSTPSKLSRPPYVQFDTLDDPGKLRAVRVETSKDEIIDVAGLDVDIACARKWQFKGTPDSASIRVDLLELGCAKLASANPVEAEKAAEAKAKQDKVGFWSTPSAATSTPRPSGIGTWSRFTDWVAQNWLALLGLLLAIVSVPWLAKGIDRWRHRWRVDVLLTGVPGAGKTDLWTAWRDNMAPKADAKPTTAITPSNSLRPVRYGDYTMEPCVIDGAGSDPASMLNSIRRSRRRNRRVIVFVVSARRQNTATGAAYDHDFVAEQRGYSNFPRAILGAQDKRLRPRLAVLFLTKFDLLSSHGPWDSNSETVRLKAEQTFDEVIRAMRKDCQTAEVPFHFIIGSSKRGWGIQDLRDSVARSLVTGEGE